MVQSDIIKDFSSPAIILCCHYNLPSEAKNAEKTLLSGLCEYLDFKGFSVTRCSPGEVLAHLSVKYYDLAITFNDLPTSKKIREYNQVIPVVFLTPRQTHYEDIIALFTYVDYVEYYPCNFDVFICKINALLKRTGLISVTAASVVNVGHFRYDSRKRKLTWYDGEIVLTQQVATLLNILLSQFGSIIPFDLVLARLFGKIEKHERKLLNNVVARLRSALSSDKSLSIDMLRDGIRIMHNA